MRVAICARELCPHRTLHSKDAAFCLDLHVAKILKDSYDICTKWAPTSSTMFAARESHPVKKYRCPWTWCAIHVSYESSLKLSKVINYKFRKDAQSIVRHYMTLYVTMSSYLILCVNQFNFHLPKNQLISAAIRSMAPFFSHLGRALCHSRVRRSQGLQRG